jgi:peptidoglycan hydrolase-like protein with peptidoglycan-binding domain
VSRTSYRYAMRALRRSVLVVLLLLATVAFETPAQASPSVAKAQRRLNDLGCNAGPADGSLGAWTRTGIIRFQAANRLSQTGSLTEPTSNRLYAAQQVRCDRRPVAGGTGRRIVISQQQNYV